MSMDVLRCPTYGLHIWRGRLESSCTVSVFPSCRTRRGTGTARKRSQSPCLYARKPIRLGGDWSGPFLLLRRLVM